MYVAGSRSRRVLRAVQKHASIRWYALGREMGLSPDQLEICGGKCKRDTDKLQAVFDKIMENVGEEKAADMLLDACHTIDLPVAGGVKEQLQESGTIQGMNCSSIDVMIGTTTCIFGSNRKSTWGHSDIQWRRR